MGKQYDVIPSNLNDFINSQKIFFVATAGKEGRVNVSPKGMDSFRIIDEHTIRWLKVTGSGNETAAHVLENQRMTIMFCAFEGKPIILKLYGTASMIQPKDSEWEESNQHFPSFPVPGRYLPRTLIWYRPPAACLCLSMTTRTNVTNLTTGLKQKERRVSNNTGKKKILSASTISRRVFDFISHYQH